MSRNFELLRQAEKEQELFGPVKKTEGKKEPIHPLLSQVKTSSKGKRPGSKWTALTQEEETKLVQRLFILPGSAAPRVVVFSGVDSGEGCSWVCARTGENLAAHIKGSVCLVDGNLRSPSLHQYFGVDNLYGLTEALRQEGAVRDFVRRLTGSNFWLLPSGSLDTDLPTLLNSDRLKLRLTELRGEFEHILINAAPLNLYADAALLGQCAEGVVMVLESNSTRREAARKAQESLEAANIRLLGAVLNNRTFPIPESLYRRF